MRRGLCWWISEIRTIGQNNYSSIDARDWIDNFQTLNLHFPGSILCLFADKLKLRSPVLCYAHGDEVLHFPLSVIAHDIQIVNENQ